MNENYNKKILFREVDGKQCPFIDINFVSETVGVPKDVLIYHISENEDLISLKDYINYGKVVARHIGIRTVLYLTQFFKKDISVWQIIIETMYETNMNESEYEKKYNAICKSLQKMCIMHNLLDIASEDLLTIPDESIDLEEELDVDVNEAENLSESTTSTKKKNTYRKNSACLPTLTEEETSWQKNAIDNAREKAKERDSTLTHTLRAVYIKMNRVYGIVFEQEKKDIREMFNIDEDEHISTLYAVTVSAQLRSLFDSILADL